MLHQVWAVERRCKTCRRLSCNRSHQFEGNLLVCVFLMTRLQTCWILAGIVPSWLCQDSLGIACRGRGKRFHSHLWLFCAFQLYCRLILMSAKESVRAHRNSRLIFPGLVSCWRSNEPRLRRGNIAIAYLRFIEFDNCSVGISRFLPSSLLAEEVFTLMFLLRNLRCSQNLRHR